MSKQILYLFIGPFEKKITFSFSKDYPCLCLCLGLRQITIIRPRLRISRHFSQILRTEALIFIFVIPYLNSESTLWKKISLLKFGTSNCIPAKGMFQKPPTPNCSNLCCEVYKLYVPWLNHNDLLRFLLYLLVVSV
jgi:hypothetical protein